MLLIKQKRVHRLVVVEGDADSKGRDRGRGEWTERDRSRARDESTERSPPHGAAPPPKSNKSRLVGIITLSDVLRYIVGNTSQSIVSGGIGAGTEWDDDLDGLPGDRDNSIDGLPPGLNSLGLRGETPNRDRIRLPESDSGLGTPAVTSGLTTPAPEVPPS